MLITQIRSQAYTSLSQMLQRPNEELLELIGDSGFQELWRQVEEAYGIEFPKSWEIASLPSLKEWDEMWGKTMGPVRSLASPIESLYKIWTNDKSCEMPFANQKGLLKSDWACHMEELLTKSGFEIPSQFAHCPDHLILELEFASVLIDEAPIEAQIKFAEHHLDWLGDLFETAKNVDAPKIYQDLYYLCVQFVKEDIKRLLDHA